MNKRSKSSWIRSLRNGQQHFGWLAIALHWSSALLIISLLILGLWMVTLTYYSQWYYPAPNLHKSLGIIFAVLLILRMTWRWISTQPHSHGEEWEKRLAHFSHIFIYLLLLSIVISGYLIVTAADVGISVFNLFDIPALNLPINRQADIAGWWHRWMSYLLIALITLHIGAAVKHQFINRDGTLSRMLGRTTSNH